MKFSCRPHFPERRGLFAAMTPLLHASLINDPFDDPGVLIDFLHEKRTILLDLGDLSGTAPRKLLRVSHVFISHAHMDHFSGFDRLLRISLGRQKQIHLFGPEGFICRTGNKLGGYDWNLVSGRPEGISLKVSEYAENGRLTTTTFRARTAFRSEEQVETYVEGGVLVDEPNYLVRAVHLDHHIPCLAFALDEKQHLNVWRNRVTGMGLGVGPWLNDLKHLIATGAPDETLIKARWRQKGVIMETSVNLADVRGVVEISRGQKIAYVTDTGYSADNITKICDLCGSADILFIEAPFLDEECEIAARKKHLTAGQAGRIARRANVCRYELFHFSSRYLGHADRFHEQAAAGFQKSE